MPFKGIHYNTEKIRIQSVVSPPYDIIPDSMQEELYKKSPYNFVRIILGKILPDDNEQNNRYTKSAMLLTQWRKEDIIAQDEETSFYIYEQGFDFHGEKRILRGFISLCRLEEFGKGGILPHEKTFKAPIQDRLNLMRACKANPEPIYCLYSNGSITKILQSERGEKILEFTGENGIWHRVLRLTDKEILNRITTEMLKSTIYIADGHHRYQTALEFSREEHLKNYNPLTMPSDYIMMLLADINDNAVTILPTHRVIKTPAVPLSDLLKSAEEFFIIKEHHSINGERIIHELAKCMRKHAIGLIADGTGYIMMPRSEELILEYMDKNNSKAWNLLDVAVLENLIFRKIMGMDNYDERDMLYTRDADEAVKNAGGGMAFLLNPTGISEVRSIADNRETMPHKSTYFFPKPLSGLVFYKW